MSAAQSKELTEFYRAYATWLDAGAPNEAPFSRWRGLCTNLRNWAYDEGRERDERDALSNEITGQFLRAGLNGLYPFGEAEFYACMWAETMHLDPKRIAWVRAHLEAA